MGSVAIVSPNIAREGPKAISPHPKNSATVILKSKPLYNAKDVIYKFSDDFSSTNNSLTDLC